MQENDESPPEETAAERARALKALFDQWDAEDATDDPEEIARRRKEWEEFEKALRINRGLKE